MNPNRLSASAFVFSVVGIVAIAGVAGVRGQSGAHTKTRRLLTDPAVSLSAPVAPGKPASASAVRACVDWDAMAGAFAAQGGPVEVIVTLRAPEGLRRAMDWSRESDRRAWRAAVRAAQEATLSALDTSVFETTHRYDNIAAISGRVNAEGLARLLNDPNVIHVKPVAILQAHLAQGIPLIHADTYRGTYQGQGMAIAICDTGIDTSHPSLGGGAFPNAKVIGGTDTGDGDADPRPNPSLGEAHGTACAGIAAGDLGTVGDYIGGVAPAAKLYAVKISIGNTGSATESAMIAGWDWCVSHQNDDPAHPIRVISTSFGGGRYSSVCDSESPAMTQAAVNAVAAGITVLASSGNDGYCDSLSWPSCISHVISVGAVYDADFGSSGWCVNSASCHPNKQPTGVCETGWYVPDPSAPDKVSAYSNSAWFLDVFAASNNAYTCDIMGSGGYSSGDYAVSFGGTSAACPYAAGAVAALQSAAHDQLGNYLTPGQVRSLLVSTGNALTDTKVAVTKPRVNLAAAIEALGGPIPTPVATPLSELFDIRYKDQRDKTIGFTTQGDEVIISDPAAQGSLTIKPKRDVFTPRIVQAVRCAGTLTRLSTKIPIGEVDVAGDLLNLTANQCHVQKVKTGGTVRTVRMLGMADWYFANQVLNTSIYSGATTVTQAGGAAPGGPPPLNVRLTGVTLLELIAPSQAATIRLGVKKFRAGNGNWTVSIADVGYTGSNVIAAGEIRSLTEAGSWVWPHRIQDGAGSNSRFVNRGVRVTLQDSQGRFATYLDSTFWPDYLASGADRLFISAKGGDVRALGIGTAHEISNVSAVFGKFVTPGVVYFYGGRVIVANLASGAMAAAGGTPGAASPQPPAPDIRLIRGDGGVNSEYDTGAQQVIIYAANILDAGGGCNGSIRRIVTKKPVGAVPDWMTQEGGAWVAGQAYSFEMPKVVNGLTDGALTVHGCQ